MAEIEVREVDLAMIAMEQQEEPEEGLLDQKVGSYYFQSVISVSPFCVGIFHHQTRNPRSATLAGSEVVGL